jgi:hypothetical protein
MQHLNSEREKWRKIGEERKEQEKSLTARKEEANKNKVASQASSGSGRLSCSPLPPLPLLMK